MHSAKGHTLQDSKRQALRAGNQQPSVNTVDLALCSCMVLLMLQKFRRWARSISLLEKCFFFAQAARLEKGPELEEERNEAHLNSNIPSDECKRGGSAHSYEQSKRIGDKPWCDEIRGFRVIQDIVSEDPRAAE